MKRPGLTLKPVGLQRPSKGPVLLGPVAAVGLGMSSLLWAQAQDSAVVASPRMAAPTPAPAPASQAPVDGSGAEGAQAGQTQDVITASLVLKVQVPEDAASALVARAEKLGGYFSRRTQQQLVLKIPAEQVNDWLAYAATLGVVAERSFERQNVNQQLVESRSRLGAREEVMKRYLELLQEAGTASVLQVEQEVNRMVGEIESIKGQLRLTEHRIQFAELTVSFKFRDRAAPLRDGRSSFPWLNTVNLADLVEDFQYEH